MPIRNRHVPGDYLMVSDLSGRCFYASEMVKQWNGLWVHHSEYETRHPQEFVRAPKESTVTNVRPQTYDPNILNDGALGVYVGATTVPVNEDGPAAHLYDFGIGEMTIADANGNNGSFIVR